MPKKTPADRLIEFGKRRYGDKWGWRVNFAKALNIRPQQLNDYFTGRISIGLKMQQRLQDMGCPTKWLIEGIVPVEYDRPAGKHAAVYAPQEAYLTIDKNEALLREIVEKLKTLEKRDLEKINAMIDLLLKK